MYIRELEGYSEREAQLRNAIDRYARLSLKADLGKLKGDELDMLFLTGVKMRKQARDLGLKRGQLEAMLEKTVRHLSDGLAERR